MDKAAGRRCSGCGCVLSRYNDTARCSRCAGGALSASGAELWDLPEVRQSLRAWDVGAIVRQYRTHTGATQGSVASLVGIDQSEVSRLEQGRKQIRDRRQLVIWTRALGVPDDLVPPLPETPQSDSADTGPVTVLSPESGIPQDTSRWDTGLVYSRSVTDTLSTVAELGRADVQRRSFLLNASYMVAAMAVASRDWLLDSLESLDSGSSRRVGPQQVNGIRQMFARFQELDVIGGGGDDVRRLVASYLADHVMPMVREPQPSDVQESLYEVASEQTYLAGWMAFDSGRHGLAQRYLVQSLRLAQASGNRMLGAHVLAGMSDQATQMGNPSEGVSLAQAGRHGLRGLDAPATLTDLYVLEARAHAVLGNASAAASAIDYAERAYDHLRPDNEPEWAKFIDEAYVTGEIASTLRDLKDSSNAERFATQSVAASMRQNRSRRASLSYAVLAASHQQRRDLEAAAAAATRALDLATDVPSIRCTVALNGISAEFAPHTQNYAVGTFMTRLKQTQRI